MQLQKNLQPWERVASIAAGVGLIAWSANRGTLRRFMTPLGVGLIARGGSGYCPVTDALGRGQASKDTRQALGGSNGINVQESITILADPASVYDVWKQPEMLTTLMPSIERLDDLDNGRSHWVVAGPAGTTVEWDAEVINDIPGKLIAWRSLPGGDVATAGSVHFDHDGHRGTRVTVRLQYDPPAGKAGAAVAKAFGASPAANIREGLEQLKAAFETGAVPATAG